MVALVGHVAPALAQAQSYNFDLPAQQLSASLMAVARTTGAQVTFDDAAIGTRPGPALKGSYTAHEALKRLTAGSDLAVDSPSAGLFVVRARPAASSGREGNGRPMADANEIVVTGSHLKRNSFDSPVPIMVADNTDLSESGSSDLANALIDMPGVDESGSLANNQSSVQNNGVSTISLRGLGSNRTLVLIDGHRTVSNLGNANAVSLSTIPTFFVDRVEVTTGGASAIYGSDAVAGVVNILTQDNMRGVKARFVSNTTSDGGGENREYSIAAGRRFLDDRLYLMGSFTYERQYALLATDRERAMESVGYSQTDNSITTPALSTYTPGGRFLSGKYFYNNDGLQKNFVTARDGYEDRASGTLITPRESYSAGAKMRYDFNSSLRFNAQFLYSRITTDSVRAAYSISNSTTFGPNDEFSIGRISRKNPYAPTDIANAAPSSGIDFRRRITDIGDLRIYNERTTLRGWAGFQGTVFDNWDWDLTYGYGRYSATQIRYNGMNMANLKEALNANVAPDGTIQCANATARAAGCVSVNLFGVGSISDAAADYLRANVWYKPVNRQDTLSGNLTGSPFSLPAGDVELAVGFELRHDKTSTKTDELTRSGLTNFAYIPEYSGNVKAAEGYVETSIPILKDVPFAYRLSIDGAARIAQYNLDGVGTTFSYRAGAQWAPVRGVAFRSTYSQAQRAPDTTELYSPPRDDFDTISDPCNGVTASSPGVIADNCRAIPGVAAAIAQNGKFTQASTNINAPNSGNPDLHEETAKTFTAGVVIQPAALRRFHLSVDYYQIKVDGAIGSLSNPDILFNCLRDSSGGENRFCDMVSRDDSGQISKILNQVENLNRLEASGIDVALSYGFDLPKVPGDFNLRARYSHRIKLRSIYDGLSGLTVDDWNGEVGTARDQVNASLGWNIGLLSVGWKTIYFSPVVDSNARKLYAEQTGVENPLYLNLSSYWRHDISFSISPVRDRPSIRIFGTVRNVFNNYGPFIPDGTDSGSKWNYNSIYSIYGRTFSLGVQTQF